MSGRACEAAPGDAAARLSSSAVSSTASERAVLFDG